MVMRVKKCSREGSALFSARKNDGHCFHKGPFAGATEKTPALEEPGSGPELVIIGDFLIPEYQIP